MKSAEAQQELRSYLVGGALSIALTMLAFAAVLWLEFSRTTTLTLIAITAVAQTIVQVHYFLHIGLGQQKREDLQLILFSLILLTLMAGGTIWIMGNLAGRMH